MIKTFFNWLEDRTGIWTLCQKIGNRPIPVRLMSMKTWPAIMFFLLFIQLMTGFILWLHYSPSTQTSYESVFYVQYYLWGGWLLRGIHHYSAQLLVASAIFYIIYQIFRNMYRSPREVVFWLSLIMFFWALGACLTGDLLSWDQNSYGATQVRIKYLTQIPFIGQYLYDLVTAGHTANSHTLTRFTALHIGVFGGGFLVLMLIHAVCDTRAEKRSLLNTATCGQKTPPTVRWWASQAMLNAVSCCIMMFFILYLVSHGNPANLVKAFPCEKMTDPQNLSAGLQYGAKLGPPADTSPSTSFGTARPEWVFRGLYQYTLNFAGKASEFVLIFIIPSCALLIFFLMPFIAKIKFGHLFNVLYIIVFCAIQIMLANTSYKNDTADKNYLEAQRQEREEALRLYQLTVRRGGLAPEGALNMLQSDWLTQGPKLFAKHCAACHPFSPSLDNSTVKAEEKEIHSPIIIGEAHRKIIPVEEPLAPNLYHYPSRQWIAGFFDSKKITSAEYFGNTALKDGSMVDYVKTSLRDHLEDEFLGEKGLNIIIDTLYSETQLSEPRPMVAAEDSEEFEKLPQGIDEETMFMFIDFGCTECHSFYDQKGGGAPDLTAYGSRNWTWRVIADPTKFYAQNDRMLAYHPESEGSDKNLMTQKEMDMLVKWLFDAGTGTFSVSSGTERENTSAPENVKESSPETENAQETVTESSPETENAPETVTESSPETEN
ncbi:MAG: cytochrome b N-terminal domain-containing protein [Planctomycetia bacterium]|nr:cytochrome b N-terminal domain-containing protein [Planctomycetia bacterium]